MLWRLMPFGVKPKTARSLRLRTVFRYFFLLRLFSRAAHWAATLRASNTVEMIETTVMRIS